MTALFSMLIFAVLGIGIPLLLFAQHQHKLDQATMIAAQLGLQTEGTAILGTYRDVAVRLETIDRGSGKNSDPWSQSTGILNPPLVEIHVRPETVVDTFVNFFSQKDIQVGDAAFDRAFLISGPDERKIRQILANPDVQRQMMRAIGVGRQIEITADHVRICTRGEHLEHVEYKLDEVVELADALIHAQMGPWAAYAARNKLNFHDDLGFVTGKLRGVRIKISEVRPTYRGKLYTRIQAHLDRPLPARTHIVHADLGSGQGATLGDPVLDSMVHVATDDIEVLRQRLATEAVRGPLLEIVHGQPTSHVDATTIVALHEGMLLELDAAVDVVVELAKALT